MEGRTRRGRHIREKRGSGMHLELRNLNFPAYLNWKATGSVGLDVNLV